jgi:peroxiredoxin
VPGIIRCPGCGQEIDANSRFCIHCTTRICPGCHGPVPPRAVYCPHCGFSVGPAVPGVAEQQPPMPPPRPFTPSPGGITGPQPRQFPPSQGGIIGPQPGSAPSYPEPHSNVPVMPASQTTQTQQYEAGGQQQPGYGAPTGVPYTGMQPPASTGRAFRDTGPIRVKRFPPALVMLVIIAVIGGLGFIIFQAGWLDAPISKAQEFVGGINLPGWLPFGNKDSTPPNMLNASVIDITANSAVVTWKTDEPSCTQLMLCESGGGCTWTEPDENLITDHSVTLNDLKSNTEYHFTATSTDACSNQGTAEGDFMTLAGASTATLVISGIKVSNITDTAVTISWSTDQPGTSQIEYGATNSYGSSSTLDQKLATSHNATLSGLQPAASYHFKVISQDGSGNEAASQDQTFTTISMVQTSTETGTEVGMRAPDFTLPTLLDGSEVSLNQFRGKIVIVDFWQDVQQSRNDLGLIQEVYGKWPDDKLVVLAISWKQTEAITQNIVTSKGLTMPILIDESGDVAAKYNVTRSPATIFIDSQGIVRDTSYYPSTLKSYTQIENILNSMQ